MDFIRGFFGKYTNLFSTLATVLSGLTIWLGQQGCLSQGDFAATCSVPWLPASWMPTLAIIFIGLTGIGKLTRPGGIIRSVFGDTAVVTPNAGVGSVTPAQVAQK